MRFAASLFVPCASLLAAALASSIASPARATGTHTFVIAGADGYGVEDCLSEGGDCGRVVADAWCEAHGHAAAVRFGRAEDVTGDIARPDRAPAAQVIFITCAD
jgi:hypothetical protein